MKFSQEITQEVLSMPKNPKNSQFVKKDALTIQSIEEKPEKHHYTTPNDRQIANNVEIIEFGGLETINEAQNNLVWDKDNKNILDSEESKYYLQKHSIMEQDVDFLNSKEGQIEG